MAHVAPVYPNFARGEVSPLMFGRIDIEQYPSCLAKCRNTYIRPYGCATRLTGTEFVGDTKNSGKVRLLKFVFSPTDSYIIECGAGYFRFYQNGGVVIKNGVPYEVQNDYYEDQLDSIQYVQLDDIIKLTCLPHNGDNKTARPKELIRKASDNWEVKDVEFKETPYLDQNITDITMKASAVTGDDITITASEDYFNADMVGANLWLGLKVTDPDSNEDVQGYVQFIDNANNSSTVMHAKVMSKLSSTNATKIWGEGAFSDYRGYPAVVALFDGRLYYARTPHPYAYETFTPAVDNEDDAGINIALATNANGDGSDIKWMVGGSYLLCGTFGGEFVIRSTGDNAITATDISARQRTNWGGEPIQPIVAGTFVHFIQRNGNKLRQFQYDYFYDAYKAVDCSIFSEHLLESPIREMALQKNPDSIIYLMRDDGKVVMLTLEQDQSVQAWSMLEEMGAEVESIQTIPSFDGNYDEVYMVMNRDVLETTLTPTCSNPNVTVINNYTGTKSVAGEYTEVLECTSATKYKRNDNLLKPYSTVTYDEDTGISNGVYDLNQIPVKDYYPAEIIFTTTDDITNKQTLLSFRDFRSRTVDIYIFNGEIGAAGSADRIPIGANKTYKIAIEEHIYLKVFNNNGLIFGRIDLANYLTKITTIGASYNHTNIFNGSIDLAKSRIGGVPLAVGTQTLESNGNVIDLFDYDISINGSLQVGDTITLTYQSDFTGSNRYIERMLNPITPDNLNEWWYVRSGLKYDGYKKTDGINLTLSDNSGTVTATADSAIFTSSMVGNRIRFIDDNYNILGEGEITEYTSDTVVTLDVTTPFQTQTPTGGKWGISTDTVSGLSHLNGREVQIYADGLEQATKTVLDGSISIDDAFIAVVGLPYTSYITTMPMEAGSQNGTAVGKRKRISEMAIRVWNSLGVRVGRDLDNLYQTIYEQQKPFTGVIPNIKYNQGWVWDADITVEQSHPYPMNILSIAPIVTEVDK